MSTLVLMPVIAEGGQPGVVTKWFVANESLVESGVLVAMVLVDHITQEVYALTGGQIGGAVPANEPVAQGQPICVIHPIDHGSPALLPEQIGFGEDYLDPDDVRDPLEPDL